MVIRKREIDLVNREIKIFQKFLEENTSETMPDPPVTQLRNGKFRQIYRVFPTPFIYRHISISFTHSTPLTHTTTHSLIAILSVGGDRHPCYG